MRECTLWCYCRKDKHFPTVDGFKMVLAQALFEVHVCITPLLNEWHDWFRVKCRYTNPRFDLLHHTWSPSTWSSSGGTIWTIRSTCMGCEGWVRCMGWVGRTVHHVLLWTWSCSIRCCTNCHRSTNLKGLAPQKRWTRSSKSLAWIYLVGRGF